MAANVVNQAQVSANIKQFTGRNDSQGETLEIKYGDYVQFSAGKVKWGNLFKQDKDGDSMLLEIVRYLASRTSNLVDTMTDVQQTVAQLNKWIEDNK